MNHHVYGKQRHFRPTLLSSFYHFYCSTVAISGAIINDFE